MKTMKISVLLACVVAAIHVNANPDMTAPDMPTMDQMMTRYNKPDPKYHKKKEYDSYKDEPEYGYEKDDDKYDNEYGYEKDDYKSDSGYKKDSYGHDNYGKFTKFMSAV